MQGINNRILIICPSMVPKMDSWGATQRMYYLANDFAERGWEVYTVSPEYEKSQVEVQRQIKYNYIYMGFSANSETIPLTGNISWKQKIVKFVRRTVSLFAMPIVNWIYNEPNCYEGIYKQIWAEKYKSGICELISNKEIETVIVSVPTFSLLRLGKIIRKANPKVRIIYDYRDPWHLWNLKKNLAYYREKKSLIYADKIVGVSETFTQDMKKTFGIADSKTYTIFNGYSERDWKRFEEKDIYINKREKLRLTFTGNMTLLDRKDNYRNPNKLIKIVKKYKDVELFLVGVQNHRTGTVDENIHYVGSVQQEESFKYMVESDVLISIHDVEDSSERYIVSGKFYDYMRSGRPIWHIGGENSLMTQMVRKYKLGIFCRNEEDKLEETIISLLDDWKKGRLDTIRDCDIQKIEMYSREYQNKLYNDLLIQNLL